MANEKIELDTKTDSIGNGISVVESDDVEYNGSSARNVQGQFARQSLLEVGSSNPFNHHNIDAS
jgi:hypothetical protein